MLDAADNLHKGLLKESVGKVNDKMSTALKLESKSSAVRSVELK